MGEMAQTFISEIEWLAALNCRATGLSTSLFYHMHDYLSYINSLSFFIYFLFLSDEGPMLKTLDNTIRTGSTPTFLYFDLYLYSAYPVHYV